MTALPSTKLVTIFGGSGFLGRHMVRALANDGWRIRVAVRRPNNANFLTPMGRVGQIQLLKANVRDDDAVRGALKDADAAINLIGILNRSGRQRFNSIHVEGAARVARLSADLGVPRLLHVSSLGANAESRAKYAKTKAEGECAVRELYPTATIFRPSAVFGPEDDFFNKFAWLARITPFFVPLPLIGGGGTKLQPVFVGDVAQAAARVLQERDTAAETFELGGPEIMTLREIMELVLKVTHRRRMLLPIPFALARIQGAVLGILPNPLITLDQVRLLERDNVVSEGARGFRELAITPEAVEAIIPSYLWRFRKQGQFEPVAP